MDHDDAPALAVISRILRSLYLHTEIREKGGAYGGFSVYNPEDGLFSLCSYRDPHILRTFRVYDRAGEFITSGKYSDEDIKEAVLQACSDIDKPDPPGPAAKKAFFRNLVGLTDDARNKFKSSLLSMTKKKVMETAAGYFPGNNIKKGNVAISNEDKLKAVNKELGNNPLTIRKI
jgi:Zn-dependent M16 (insulinase) family peptidase